MTDLEKLYTSRVAEHNDNVRREIEKYEKIRDEELKICKRFFDKISFLNNYGFKLELMASCNNGRDCCMPRYAWNVYIRNRTMATTPFESIIDVKEFGGEVKARFRPTILGSGRYVKGADKDGYFTAEQFVMAFSQ